MIGMRTATTRVQIHHINSGTRDRGADRYNAGPNPLPSSGTQDRGASRYNAGSNPPSPTSGTHRSEGREIAGPNPSSTSSRNHAGLFAAFNRRQTRKESAPDVIDLEEQSSHHASGGSEQDSTGIGSTPFHLLDIPFHQPPRRGNEDDETIPGILDVIDEAEITPERRTTSLPPSRVAKVLSPKPFIDDVAQRLDLTQPDHDRAQLRGSSSLDFSSGQTGTDSRATKRSSESPQRREAVFGLRSICPAHHDPIDVPIRSAGSGLSSNAPMSEKDTDDGIIATPRNRRRRSDTAVPGNGGLPSNPPTDNSIVPTFFQIGTPSCTPNRNEDGELVTLTAVLPLPLPQMRAILSPLSFSDSFSRFTTRSRGARLKSRGAELRFVHVGMISAHALVRSRRSTTALTPSRKRLSHPFLPSPERSRDTRPSSVKSTSGSLEARRR